MISAIGHACLSAAVLVAAGGLLAAAASVRFGSARARRAAMWSVISLAGLFTVASAALIVALLTSDFRFQYVAGYTERALPFGYKLAAFWAGQEGSLLLWAWLLGGLSVLALRSMRSLASSEQAIAVGTLAAVNGFFAALLLFAADPFKLIVGAVPPDGRGLNPMLQDPGMLAHPPLLFLGYAACAIPFAILVGVLVHNRLDNRWLGPARRWLLVAWLFLTAGIVLGAWWAYIELGWGGYWAWDPVENASLLPWLTLTAVLHSITVQQRRGMFKLWNASLIALTFILCIFGTYLTRSGVIDSVHSFAPSLIGSFFLAFLVVNGVFAAGLIAWRHRSLRPDHELEGLVSREGALLLGNVLLLIMMLTTLLGTIFPLISRIVLDDPVTVSAPFYNRVVAPMGLLLVAVMATGPVLAPGRQAARRILGSLALPAVLAALVTGAAAAAGVVNVWALVCIAVAGVGTFAVIVGFVRSVAARRRSTGEAAVLAAARLIDRDHRRYGGQMAHLGVMLLVIGVAGSSLYALNRIVQLAPGETAQVGRYSLHLVSIDQVRGPNHSAVQATIRVSDPRGRATTLRPQTRFYDTWGGEPNTEIALQSTWRDDLYVTLAGWEDGGSSCTIQVRVNPLVLWIWIGGILMVASAIFCLVPPLLPRRHSEARATTPAIDATATARPAAHAPGDPLVAELEALE